MRILLFLLLGLFSSCGYHFKKYENHFAKSFFLKEIIQDRKGSLEEEIIKAVTSDSLWKLDSKSPKYVLSCRVIDINTDQIGYRYDRNESTSKIINRLIPIEARKKIKVQISVEDTEKSLSYGPFSLESYSDYDFVNFDSYTDLAFIDTAGNPQATLSYSLGQLDACEGSEEAALRRCYQEIAMKIFDLLQNL